MKKHENKFSKRAFAILLALALCMGMLPFTAVAKSDGRYCVGCKRYEVYWVEQVDATCEHEGVIAHYSCLNCSRNYFLSDIGTLVWDVNKVTRIPQLNHSYTGDLVVTEDGHAQLCVNGCNEPGESEKHTFGEWKVELYATCGTDGEQTRTCTVCNFAETQVIPATNQHSEAYPIVKEATCTTPGSERYFCAVCNKTLRTVTIPVDPTAHNFGGEYVEAGTGHARMCQNEGCKAHDTVQMHQLTTTTTPATCGVAGSVVRECKVCGYSNTQVVEALQHDFSKVRIMAATCTKDGFTVKYCARCGRTQETSKKVLKATGHQFSAWTLDIAGYVTHSHACTVCGEKETALHNFGEWVPDTENKTKTQTCKTCGYSVTESIPTGCKHPATERTTEEKAPTCTENGYKTVTCTKCDTVIEHTDSPASGHSFGEWVQVSDILRTRTCTVCDFVEEERLPGPELPPVIVIPPVEPVDPVDPIDPVDPVDPDDGDGDVDIDDPDVPLGPGPGDTEEPDGGDVDIDDPDVPLGPGPGGDEDGDDTSGQQPGGSDNKPQNPGNSGNGGEDEIEDEPVPLAATPKTGDNQGMLWVLFLVSGAALTGLVFAEKKRGEQ